MFADHFEKQATAIGRWQQMVGNLAKKNLPAAQARVASGAAKAANAGRAETVTKMRSAIKGLGTQQPAASQAGSTLNYSGLKTQPVRPVVKSPGADIARKPATFANVPQRPSRYAEY